MGTWKCDTEEGYEAILHALKLGYRHIDTAAVYLSEENVGRAIKDSGIDRRDIFVTTKLAPVDQLNAREALEHSLQSLQLEYVDLYLMHWPVALNKKNKSDVWIPVKADGSRDILLDWDYLDTYHELEKFVEEGKVKSIGVSNFNIPKLKRILEDSRTKYPPVVNQVELHPYLPQQELLDFAKLHQIILEAYSPLGSTSSPLISDETIKKLSEKYQTSPATILISWAIWRGTVVIPKSSNKTRVASNLIVGHEIDNIHKTKGIRRLINPNWSPIKVFEDQ